ncbi:hypothetical protein EJ02DRAFT_458118 [Clathrospora elynae]|uniref:Ecp2 effector protein domain-containing protein n=1 Tax=Clathrospora elynae TaxID=706981 RepID=A0A6A5SI07_9PLEO|nr:hypothetical protein EJ02DRAFT_458118 [Clathrospora elynae]
MYTTTLLSALAATISFTLAAATIHNTTNTDTTLIVSRSISCGKGTHFPTENQYRQAVAQYCDKWIGDQLNIQNLESFALTFTLKDKRGYPIKWVLKTEYLSTTGTTPNAPNQGTPVYGDHPVRGPTYIFTNKACHEAYVKWADADVATVGKEGTAFCYDGDTRLIMGGLFQAGGAPKGKGARLNVETRQRLDDKYMPPK